MMTQTIAPASVAARELTTVSSERMAEPKIHPRHLLRRALIYVRQSHPNQVQRHPESARRQYGLVERAEQLGWGRDQISVIDEDQGKSGAGSAAAHGRDGFAQLVSAVGLGEIGIVLALEVSRLARDNTAWYRLLDLAGAFGWSPMGTVRPEFLSGLPVFDREIEGNSDESSRLASGLAQDSYCPRTDRMVLIEDALNLADALDRAFLEREPRRRHPAAIVFLPDWEADPNDMLPGQGVMRAVVEMCRQGPFWIELS